MVATRNDRGIHVQDFDGRQSKSDGPKQVGAQPRWRPYTIARPSVKPDEAEQAMRNDPLDMNYEVIDGEQRWTSLGRTGNFRSCYWSGPCGTMPYGSSLRGLLERERGTPICVPRDY